MPMTAVHSEYVLIADIVIAADTTVFSDFPHLTFGILPGDGIYLAWEEAIGLNRARYLTLTQGSFTAEQAERWGAVAEVLPPGPGAAAGAGTRRGSRRQAAVADQVPGGHRAPAPQPPDGRGISARLGAGRPHRR
jgi:enoyl-CoA hydratase/carnithine racemase